MLEDDPYTLKELVWPVRMGDSTHPTVPYYKKAIEKLEKNRTNFYSLIEPQAEWQNGIKMKDIMQYMHLNNYTEEYLKQLKNEYKSNEPLKFDVYDKVTILPAKEDIKRPWGIGGVLDSEGNYISTFVEHVFGGKYGYTTPKKSVYEEVIYIPVAPKQWGHFIIDVLCRFWWFDNEEYKKYKIAYISKDWSSDGISGNYLEILQLLLGKDVKDRLLFITEPTAFEKILIPEPSFTFGDNYHQEYKSIIDSIIQNANLPSVNNLRKIYLSRTGIHQYTEVGEKEIEELFKQNGYAVIHPEQLTFFEQVQVLQEAEEIVGMSGSNMHNIIFARDNASITIINRAGAFNPPQIRIDKIKKANVTVLDAYDNDFYTKYPHEYGSGPFLVGINDNVLEYSKNHGFQACYSAEQLLSIRKLNVKKYYYYTLARFFVRAYKKVFRLLGIKKK